MTRRYFALLLFPTSPYTLTVATGIDDKSGVRLLLKDLGFEDIQDVLDAMYPIVRWEKNT